MTGILKVDQWKDSGDNALISSNGSGALTFNASSITGITQGITEADTWRLNTSFNVGNTTFNDLTSNLERDDSTGFGYIGTGMSQSGGYFTFPSTGIWLIMSTWIIYDNANVTWFEGFTRTTIDNASYATRVQCSATGGFYSNGSFESSTSGSCLFDVTDTSQCKLQFAYQSSDSGTNVYGGNTANVTHFQFIRLGDT
jgi:hypothetical protein